MDAKGRPTAADIPDRMFLGIVDEKRVGELEAVFPRKVVRAKAAKLAKRGLIEVTADNFPRWLTHKGEAVLAGMRSSE